MEALSSDILFSRPSFVKGVCRSLDLFGQMDAYNVSPSPAEADRLALCADSYMLGLDYVEAVTKVGEGLRQELANRVLEPGEE